MAEKYRKLLKNLKTPNWCFYFYDFKKFFILKKF